MPRIGGMFFSTAYLMTNRDKNEFTIARAQTTPAKQKLIAFDTANNCTAEANVLGADPTTPSGSDSSGPPSDSGISGGAIAGIVIGVVAGIAIIIVAAFLVWRRKRNVYSPSDSTVPLESHVPMAKYGHDASEMYSDNAIIELGQSDNRQVPVELDGSTRPSEAPEYGAYSPREAPGRV